MGAKESKPVSTLETSISQCVDEHGNLCVDKIKQLKVRWDAAKCDIAILGESGSGKSSLINNLLGASRKSSEENDRIKAAIEQCNHIEQACNHTYAPTDSNECTTRATPYTFPDCKDVRVWDLPGYGKQLYPSIDAYWKELEIEKYGAYICVLRDNRLDERIKTTVDYVLERRKSVIWVRTYFDAAMNGKDDVKEEIEKEKQKAKEFIKKLSGREVDICAEADNIIEGEGPHKQTVYFVSGLYNSEDQRTSKYKYDLDQLKAALIAAVPPEQRFLLARRIRGHSKELINTKYRVLQWWTAANVLTSASAAAASSLIPIAGALVSAAFDITIVKVFASLTAETFGFSDKDSHYSNDKAKQVRVLQLVAIANRTVADLLVKIVISFGVATVAETVCLNTNSFFVYLYQATSFLPVVGAAVSSALSLSVTAIACHKINTTYRDAAFKLLSFIEGKEDNIETAQKQAGDNIV